MEKMIISIGLLCCLVFFTYFNTKDDSYYTVLKIGDVTLTNKQYEKLLKNYLNNKQIDSITNLELEKFNQSVINDYYFLADAYKKGYQHNDSIIEIVDATADYMLTMHEGFLWNATRSEKTIVTESEIREVYNRLDTIYHFEYIRFNKKLISDTTNNSIINSINSVEDFDKLFKMGNRPPEIEVEKYVHAWPLIEFGEGNKYMQNMAVGEFFGPQNTLPGVYFAKLIKKETITPPPYSEEEKRLKFLLGILKTHKIILNERLTCEFYCQPKYFDQNIFKYLDTKNQESIANNVLAEYTISGERRRLTVEEFNSFLKYEITLNKMNKPIDVKVNLREKIGRDFQLTEIDSLKLRDDPRFKDEYNGFHKKLILLHYLSEEIKPDLQKLEVEAKRTYQNNIEKFKEPKFIVVNYYLFEQLGHLFQAQKVLNELRAKNLPSLPDTSRLDGLIDYKKSIEMKRDSTFLSSQNYSLLAKMPVNSFSRFNEDGKQFILVVTDRKSSTVRTFQDTKDEILNELKNKRIESERRDRLKSLKKLYKIYVNKLEVVH